jgi:hypothetical protein
VTHYFPESSYIKLEPPKAKLRSEEVVGNIWERAIDKGVVSVSADTAARSLCPLAALAFLGRALRSFAA